MRDSLALLDQISVLDADKEITSDDVNDMLGRLSFETLFDISNAITTSDTQTAITLLDGVYNKGNEPFQIITNLIQYYRNLLVVKNCTDRKIAAELTQLSEAHILKLREQAENVEAEQILYIIERLSFYSKEIKETTNRYLWLELCIIELSSNVKYSSYSQLIERIERLESGITTNAEPNKAQIYPSAPPPLPPAFQTEKKQVIAQPKESMPQSLPKAEPVPVVAEAKESIQVEHSEPQEVPPPVEQKPEEPAPTVAQTTGNSTDLATAWQGILQNITSIPSRMFFYNLSRPVELSPDGITIAFMNDIFVKQAQDTNKNTPLKNAAMAYFGVSDINIHIKLADENDLANAAPKPSIEKLERKPAAQPQKTYNEKAEEEESIQLIKETLGSQNSTEKTSSEEKNHIPSNLSDQSKMVMELFNGKYID